MTVNNPFYSIHKQRIIICLEEAFEEEAEEAVVVDLLVVEADFLPVEEAEEAVVEVSCLTREMDLRKNEKQKMRKNILDGFL